MRCMRISVIVAPAAPLAPGRRRLHRAPPRRPARWRQERGRSGARVYRRPAARRCRQPKRCWSAFNGGSFDLPVLRYRALARDARGCRPVLLMPACQQSQGHPVHLETAGQPGSARPGRTKLRFSPSENTYGPDRPASPSRRSAMDYRIISADGGSSVLGRLATRENRAPARHPIN